MREEVTLSNYRYTVDPSLILANNGFRSAYFQLGFLLALKSVCVLSDVINIVVGLALRLRSRN